MSFKASIKVVLSVFIVNTLLFSVSAQNKLRFQAGDDLATIRSKIKANNYKFTVKENWVTKLSKEQRAKMFSRHPGKVKEVAAVPDSGPLLKHLGKELDPAFDWRDVGGKSYIGAIRNQGSLGSCYAFGACATAEGVYNYATGNYDENCADFSESYIAWCLGSLTNYKTHFYGGDGADYDYYELRALTENGLYPAYDGICTEAECPYSETEINASTYLGNVTTIQFDSWNRVYPADYANTTEQIKTAISTYGVVDAAVYVGSAFEAYSSGIYEDSNTTTTADPYYNATTNHAISLVGWDDAPAEGGDGCWILRNSWGASWGESGYMRISYKSAAVNCAVAYLIYTSTPTTATLTMAASPTDGGTTSPTVGSSTVNTGEAQAISATPAATYTFSHWSYSDSATVADESSASTTVTLTGDATVTANFNGGGGTTTILTMAVSPASSGTTTPVAGTSTVTVDAAQSITATAADGYEFSAWSISGNGTIADSTSSSTTATLSGNSTVTATFSAIAEITVGKLNISLDNSKDNKDKIIISKAEYPSDASTSPSSAEVVIDGVSYECATLVVNSAGTKYTYKSDTTEPNVRLTIDVNKLVWGFKALKTDVNETIDASDGITVVLKIDDSVVATKTYSFATLTVKTKISHKE
jgi:C1A family cysteine protease